MEPTPSHLCVENGCNFLPLNSEEIHFFAPKDCRCNLLSTQIILPFEKLSSIGMSKSGTNQLEYILLIKHWNCWRRVKEGALAPPPWFLSLSSKLCTSKGAFLPRAPPQMLEKSTNATNPQWTLITFRRFLMFEYLVNKPNYCHTSSLSVNYNTL